MTLTRRADLAQGLANALNRIRLKLPGRVYLWICDRLYHELAGLYDLVAMLVSAGRWTAWGRAASRGLRGRVIEVGPGPGHVLAALRRSGVAAIGIELSPAMASRAQGRAGGGVVRGDGRALPLRDGCADALLLTFPAGYVREPAFWREAARVVRPGGRLRILLEAGRAYGSASAIGATEADAAWRVRRARVRSDDATLHMLLGRRRRAVSPDLGD